MQFTGIGQDSHRFESKTSGKPLILGGITIPGCPGLEGNSDADVILHAVTNAISGVTTVNILGDVSDRMCLEKGMTDSTTYLAEAMRHMKQMRPIHLSISLECAKPKLAPHIPAIREKLGFLLNLPAEHVAMTATTGEGLTAFGRGEGIFCTALITVDVPDGK